MQIGYVERNRIEPVHAAFSLPDVDLSLSDAHFGERVDVEKSKNIIQPIVIATIINESKTKVLAVKKDNALETSPEVNKQLLYVGGHTEPADAKGAVDFVSFAQCALARELEEELGAHFDLPESEPFCIYTPFDEKTAAHFAICFPVTVSDDILSQISPTSELSSVKVMNVSDIREDKRNRFGLDVWSELIFSHIFGGRAARITSAPILRNAQVDKIWAYVQSEYETHLKAQDVRPINKIDVARAKGDSSRTYYSAPYCWIVCLTYFMGEFVSKDAISKFTRKYRNDLKQDQQVRHIKSRGWNVTVKDGYAFGEKTPSGYHMLINLCDTYEGYASNKDKRATVLSKSAFESIKAKYGHRCATCDAKEGEIHPKTGVVVKLQQGHKNPAKPLSERNCIPQCQYCNQSSRNRFVYASDGSIEKINDYPWFSHHMTDECSRDDDQAHLVKYAKMGLINIPVLSKLISEGVFSSEGLEEYLHVYNNAQRNT